MYGMQHTEDKYSAVIVTFVLGWYDSMCLLMEISYQTVHSGGHSLIQMVN